MYRVSRAFPSVNITPGFCVFSRPVSVSPDATLHTLQTPEDRRV